MPTNRELFFELKTKRNKYLTDYIIKLLLCNSFNYRDFTELLLNFDKTNSDCNSFYEKAKRIESGEPYQYVMKEAYFLNDKYYVDENVLIPRQETEQLIIEIDKKIKELQGFCPKTMCDICTGSGILAIEMKKRYPDSSIYATDISNNALKVANKNSKEKGLNIVFKQGDLLEPLLIYGKFDVLLCNPPYIEQEDEIDPQVLQYEPREALIAKPGTIYFQKIFEKMLTLMNDKFIAGFEIGENQKEELTRLVNIYFKNVKFTFKIDMYNKNRFLLIWKN